MASFYAGLWISGADKNYYSIGHDLASFTLRATERHKAGYALIGIRTYGSGKSRLWAGVWRAGTDANYFSVDKDITEFTDLATKRHDKDLRLVDGMPSLSGRMERRRSTVSTVKVARTSRPR